MDFSATHQLDEKTDFLIGAELRYGNDQGHLTYRRITTGFPFHWRKFLTLEPYYQYSVSDSFVRTLDAQNRLAFAATVNSLETLELRDRNLGERRFMMDGQEWRYRNRVEFRRPLSVYPQGIERFRLGRSLLQFDRGQVVSKPFCTGCRAKTQQEISIDLFYVHQNDGYSHPGDLNGVGMTLKTAFSG